MHAGLPDGDTVRAAIALAVHAPSIHNSQPWRWQVAERALHLFADPDRHLAATDPGGRDLVLSCGAMLHHARVAFAALGWASTVRRLPDPARPEHLAAVEFTRRDPAEEDRALSTAIGRRRTDRRRFSSWPVPPVLLAQLAERAAEQGTTLVAVTDPAQRRRLAAAIDEAAIRQHADPVYAAELAAWSGRGRGAVEGVPAANVPLQHGRRQGVAAPLGPGYGDITMRTYEAGELAPTPETGEPDAAELLVLATTSDDTVARLRAGEALSAVLLAATDFGLATCPLSQPLEIGTTRAALHDHVLGGRAAPQIVLRVGWAPPSSPPIPASGRRPVDDVLDRIPRPR
ncbi:Acg family FMN-binding oxidoreductase [Gandjariella thermophila]|uniref:NAD(P)H nitroreductase n=1 Tax=Gandjariella thermophila TaxID=1931992 RepID=A0A4D4J4Z8_9PSEU|nr:nitroreductase family protein [Gandjariella thermophila]GDY29808.1 NAD(P)H nitroreductase [Gandjariella thermophila]